MRFIDAGDIEKTAAVLTNEFEERAASCVYPLGLRFARRPDDIPRELDIDSLADSSDGRGKIVPPPQGRVVFDGLRVAALALVKVEGIHWADARKHLWRGGVVTLDEEIGILKPESRRLSSGAIRVAVRIRRVGIIRN